MNESQTDGNTAASRWERHLPVSDNGVTAVSLLAAHSPLSKQKIKQAMIKGAVWLTRSGRTQRLRRASKSLLAGDELHIYYDEQVLARVVPDAILLADEVDYSVWHKPYGMLAQGSEWGDHCSLLRFSEKYFQPARPAFLLHRLDRSATGIMLLAHNKRTAAELSQSFQKRCVEKRYQVIVAGQFPHQTLPIEQPLDGKRAKSLACLRSYDSEHGQSLLDVSIETGRKHQIRRHLSAVGFPVLGDPLYGEAGKDTKLQLCAVELVLHIKGELRRYTLPPSLQLCSQRVSA